MDNEEIAYQNKDITSKMLAENFKGKTFRVYGLDLPGIKRVLPTNIPVVKANELRIDNLFELEDGTVAIVDYESEFKKENSVKYLNYLTGIANRYLKEKKDCPYIHMVVIYTGDIRREQVSAEYNIGAVKLNMKTAFLSELDSDNIFLHLKEKVEKNEMLDNEELMEFIILPLSYHKKEEKEKKIRETLELATRIQDREQQVFTLAGILAFTDKVINKKVAEQIRKVIEMTQVARIFEEEKQQAITQVARIFEEEKKQALAQATKTYEEEKQQEIKANSRQIVINMIKKNYPPEEIASLVSGYSQDDVEKLMEEINNGH